VDTGPSPEELRRRAEAKDLNEAAQDADDKGIDFYEKGDWDSAIREFREALEYAPDDPDILDNLHHAEARANAARIAQEQKVRESEAARQLMSVQQHSEAAQGLASKSATEPASVEARRGFDTGGQSAGGIPGPAVYAGSGSGKDPVVPKEKRTPAITKLERDRTVFRKEITTLDQKLKTLDPQKDSVEISKIKQQESTAQNKIHYLNFSISEELKKPTPAPQSVTAK
jgi:tetratricopeptide (TPR) repeat protein